MYRSKKDIDRHVESLMSKLSLKEFKLRAYSIARLYFDVGDYSGCQKFVEQYLSQKDNNAAAYKLLGQALNKLGQKEKALEQYKTSLDLDPSQTSLILDICELLSDGEVLIDPGRAKYWCEKAEAIFPRHPMTFKLKERLITLTNPNSEDLVKFLNSELASRPKDLLLHARLLKHYLQTNNVKKALEHSYDVEFGGDTFLNNNFWYETLKEIIKDCSLYRNDCMYQLLSLTIHERLCSLSLCEVTSGTTKSIVETNELLHQYDQAIENVKRCGAPSGFAEFHSGLMLHHHGQLAIHIASFILKKAKKNQIKWNAAIKVANPLMLIAWHTAPIDTKVNWLRHSPQNSKIIQNAVERWFIEGAYRCSQAGHYLLSNIPDKNQSFMDLISQSCSGKHWCDKLYEKVFPSRDHLAKIQSSYFVSGAFTNLVHRLPRVSEVEGYDKDAQRLYSNSLHHFVWTLANYKDFSRFQCTLFDLLTPRAKNYANSGPETLSKLDIMAFLYCATFTSIQQSAKGHYLDLDKPKVLPANITSLLCTLSQSKWWDCAYKFSQNQIHELTDIRSTLSHGIEIVRCVDSHGLDPELLCKVGCVFNKLAKYTTSLDDKDNLEARTFLYYSSAIPLLEKLKNKMVIKITDKRMFDYTSKDLSNKEINKLLEESQIYVAQNYLNKMEYENALDTISNLKSPQAYFITSQIYKKLAISEHSTIKDDSMSNSKVNVLSLLSKAKSFAGKTIDGLLSKHEDVKHPLFLETQELIEEIDSLTKKLDLDSLEIALNDVDGKYLSDENISSTGSEHIPVNINSNIIRNLSSTPKHSATTNITNYRTAVDSQLFDCSRNDVKQLERIEKEVKNLQKRDTNMSTFMEQTKDFFEENRALSNKIMNTISSNIQSTTDQLKQLKLSVDQVKEQIDECRTECKDVGELKQQISELKKEVNKLKKITTEQNIDENELYNLENECRANENAASFSAQLPLNPQMLAHFNQRLLPQFQMQPYQLYNQNLYNLYNQYSQFPQTAPVAGAPPLFDSLRSQMNYPGVFPTPEQLYADMAHLLPPSVPTVPTMPVVPTVPVAPPVVPSIIPTVTSVSTPRQTSNVKDTPKSLPVNVVITSSDPLPSSAITPQPVLSVTIPQKHIKSSPHNYQIQMPVSNDKAPVTQPIFTSTNASNSFTSSTSQFNTWNQNTLFKTAQNLITTPKSTNENSSVSIFGTPKTNLFQNSISVVDGNILNNASPNTSLNKSRTLSEKSNTSVESYDPCPDFKPIVPLPAEVKVSTGEENEEVVFSARAKLFRFADNQWKERGIGDMKLLKHKTTEKVRVLMRREQIHKICANHIITPDMTIQPMKDELKAYFWAANDFADECVVFEKFCVRFKTAEVAKKFYEAFEMARKQAKSSPQKPKGKNDTNAILPNTSKAPIETAKLFKETEPQTNKTVVGGFTFSSTPTFKPLKEDKPDLAKVETTTTTKDNPFSAISFKTTTSSPFSSLFNVTSNVNSNTQKDTPPKLNISDTVEEFEPTIDFKPVVPLPALVDSKTGEENEIILFEHRAKLFRFESSTKEWKERGLGNMKLLLQKDNDQKLRLLMRREQVLKVCCNHSVTKEMVFEKLPAEKKNAITWCAKDFSEGALVAETFCLRFKTAEICDNFIAAVTKAQSKLKSDITPLSKVDNTIKESSQTIGFGDKFKPKSGTWECKECYIRNESNVDYCGACNSPKDPTMPKKDTNKVLDGAGKFNFGITFANPATTIQVNKSSPLTAANPVVGFGDKFKPKAGTWECKECLIRNESSIEYCSACNSPKDPSMPKKETKSALDGAGKFNFGIPAASSQNIQEVVQTKPTLQINQVKSDDKPLLGAANSGSKFSFGVSKNSDQNVSKPNISSIFDGSGSHKFTFGTNPQEKDSSVFGSTGATGIIFATPKKPDASAQNAFGLVLKKNDDLTVKVSATKSQPETLFGSKECGKFDFVFKPTTPIASKGKSPAKTPKSENGDESDGNEYASEDEGQNLHFSPVVPLPDKIEVVTGEENEEELYGSRAKLFRFISGEWKERGIGVVKILKHKDNGKLRVVMRREQVLKICLNHSLTSELEYKAKDEKTWLFAAYDFSEGELSLENFCLRFKNKATALDFKEAADKARGIEVCSEISSRNDNVSDDVVFVNEIQATDEEKEMAKSLMLPENFYTYKNKIPCQGCRGCEKQDVAIISSATNTLTSTSETTTTPVKSLAAPSFFSPASSLYGTPANVNKTVDNSIFRTPMDSNKSTPVSGNSDNDKENTFTTVFGGQQKINFSLPKFGLNENMNNVTSSSTKASVLAAPKLSVITTTTIAETKNNFGIQQSKSVFGTSNESTSIFGNATDQKPLFGSGNSDTASVFGTNKHLFGNAVNSESKPLFGGFASENKSLFGQSKPLFGGATQGLSVNKSIFGSNQSENQNSGNSEQKTNNVFGMSSNIFGSANTQKSNIFNTSTEPIGNNNTLASILANSTPFSMNNQSKINDNKTIKLGNTETKDEKKEILPKVDDNLSFAALSTSGPGFEKNKQPDFQWEGAGQQLFGRKPHDPNNDSKEGEEGHEGGADEEYDPHYDPIVPLPDKIVVSTGEEDEEKLFGERCKLYRYYDKSHEWKERGVGEMKILYHSERKSYRMLLRREQVHKAVLNMLIIMDLELLPMKNQDRAWTWAGINYAENVNGEQETLAVRFKSLQLASNFRDVVVDCVRKLQAAAAQALRDNTENQSIAPLRLPKHLEATARADPTISIEAEQSAQTTNNYSNVENEAVQQKQQDFTEDVKDYDEHHYGEYDEEYYNEDDNETNTYYICSGEARIQSEEEEKWCPDAQIHVLFDQEVYAPKILVTDSNTGEILADMLIHTETEFELSGDTCTWSGTDFTIEPVDKTITIYFGDTETAMQFYDSCETSKAATYSAADPES